MFLTKVIKVLSCFLYSAQFEQVQKDELVEKEFQKKRTVYAEDVRSQIREKEKERVQARQAFFHEGIKLDQEAKKEDRNWMK